MRARTIVIAVVTTASLVGAPSAARAEVRSTGRFMLAGWTSIDRFHSVTIIGSGPSEGPVDVAFDSTDETTVVCPDGARGMRWVQTTGSGTGLLAIDRPVARATLRATIDLERTTSLFCETGVTSRTRRLASVDIGTDLVGIGRRGRETTASWRHVPGSMNAHWMGGNIRRTAAGTMFAGARTVPVTFGDFGRMWGTTHLGEGDLAVAAAALPYVARATEGAGITSGSMVRAEGVHENTTDGRYAVVKVGGERYAGEDPVVYVIEYSASTSSCPDGSQGVRERLALGEGPGTLDVRGGLGHSRATGIVDLWIATFDGCAGTAHERVAAGVAVGVSLEPYGAPWATRDLIALRTPSEQNGRLIETVRGRDAGGSISVGGRDLGTTSGTVLRLAWRLHDQRS